MLRKVAVGSAAAGAAAAPSTSQCYSRPSARPHAPEHGSQTFDFKGGNVAPAETWEWVFPEEEVHEVATQVLGFDPKTTTVIEEIDAHGEAGSSGSDSAGTSTYLMEADRRIVSQAKLQESFGGSLLTLLNDRGVQHACMRALQQDPAFSEMLTQLEQDAPLRGAQSLPNLLPPAAQPAEAADAAKEGQWQEASVDDTIKIFLDSVADRVVGLGNNIRSAWDAAGAAVGSTVLRMGYAIRQLLGHRFQSGGSSEYSWECVDPPQEASQAVGKVVMKVAVVVFALLVFKRIVR